WPGRAVAAAGTSGWIRLCPGTACSAMGLDGPWPKRTSGMSASPSKSHVTAVVVLYRDVVLRRTAGVPAVAGQGSVARRGVWCGCGVRGGVGDAWSLGALGGSVVDALLSPGHRTHHRRGVGTCGTCSTCAVDGGRRLPHRGVRGAFMPLGASVEIGDHRHLLPHENNPYGRKWTRGPQHAPRRETP